MLLNSGLDVTVAHPEPDYHNERPRRPPLPLAAEELHVPRKLLLQHLVTLIVRDAVRRSVAGSGRRIGRQPHGGVGSGVRVVGRRGKSPARQRRCPVAGRQQVSRR